MTKKKILIGMLIFATMVIVGVGGVYAYLASGDSATNVLTVGGVNTEIVEEFTPPTKLEPGVSFTKDVSVKNLGPSGCYIRIKAVFTDSDMEKYCTVDWNTDDFVYNEKDGYYYYVKPLDVNETSASLFTTVTLSDDIKSEEIKDFDILIYSEAFQSSGYQNDDGVWTEFNNYEEAWAYYHRNKPQ